MTQTTLRKTIYLKATRLLVWDYLTDPVHLAKWFHAPKAPLTEGDRLELFGTTSGELLIWGEVMTAQKPERLVYTFTVGPMGDAVSTVSWTLHDVPGGTRLELVHDDLPQGADAFGLALALDKGWDEHFMQMRGALHDAG